MTETLRERSLAEATVVEGVASECVIAAGGEHFEHALRELRIEMSKVAREELDQRHKGFLSGYLAQRLYGEPITIRLRSVRRVWVVNRHVAMMKFLFLSFAKAGEGATDDWTIRSKLC